MNNALKLIISLALPFAVAATGAYFTVTGTGSWYQSIQKPSWNPPGWLFGPVWSTLYLMMGISFFIIWKSKAAANMKKGAMVFWLVQLVLNFLWTIIFFNQHLIGLATIEIILLWLFILATIFAFAPISKLAAWLLVPYISWVTFASILTFTIWQLNR